MEKMSTGIAVLLGLHIVLLDYSNLVQSQGILDFVSTRISCDRDVEDPPFNRRWCYRTTYTRVPPFVCSAAAIDRTNFTVKFVDSLDDDLFTEDGIPQSKIWSPNKLRGENYQPNRFCFYNADCPPGHFMHYSWLNGNFELEPEVNGRCLDFVRIRNFDRPTEDLCGSLPGFADQRSVPLEVTFRSNTARSTRFPGFQIDILCVSPMFANLPNCTLLSTGDSGDATSTPGRKKRTTVAVSQTLKSISVPREATILYVNNVVKVVLDGEVLRVFRNIRTFFFWTGYNGTRTFRRSAPSSVNIFGGGNLRVIKYTAYYSTVGIPPEFVPSKETIKVISMLLNATSPFFIDEEPLDTEPQDPPPTDPPTTKPPPTKKPPTRGTLPPYRYRYYGKRAAGHYSTGPGKHHRAARQTEMDERIDPEALAMAEMSENACDVFLREASRSYLRILEDLGIRPQSSK